MKIYLPAASLLLFALGSCLVVFSLTNAQTQEKPVSLGDVMDDLNAAYRRLTRQVKDPAKNPDSLRLVAAVRQAVEISVKLEPELAGSLPPDQRAKFLEGYRRDLKKFSEVVAELEAALVSNDNAGAAKLLDTMKDLRNEGHKRYKKPDDK